ncbi:hypothetical protein AVEN_85603-2-1, partial [Araneus ventricosus]
EEYDENALQFDVKGVFQNSQKERATKRLLRIASNFYDLLRILASAIITGKLLYQETGFLLEDINPEVILNLKPQWPLGIKLPVEDFSRQLLEALEKERILNWVQSSELVNHLANHLNKFKKYPNKQERLQICEELVQRFPYIKSEIGLGVGGWEIKLLNKLKKIRQSDPSLETELNRIKRKSNSGIVPKRIKLNPEKGEVNWTPDHIEGEDEISQTTHQQIMIEESKRSIAFQNKIKTKSLMALTFSFRQNSINNNPSIKYLKEQ